ncbi:MAG: terminase [Acidobacteria bacterium]|nr:terminase [Acidobacteriota bacterium]
MEQACLTPDPWQARVLSSDAVQILLLCARQVGKSTVTAAMALYRAIMWPDSLILLLSPSLRQSGELFRKVVALYRAQTDPVPIEAVSSLRLELANGSRIVSLPGTESTIRGFSGVRLLIVDEASRVPDELYFAIRPMLAVSNGRLVALSTPFGKRGFFFNAWQNESEWQRFKVTAADCPRVSSDFLTRERRSLGERWFNQEYLCEFAEPVDAVFSLEVIQRAITPEVRPLFNSSAGG